MTWRIQLPDTASSVMTPAFSTGGAPKSGSAKTSSGRPPTTARCSTASSPCHIQLIHQRFELTALVGQLCDSVDAPPSCLGEGRIEAAGLISPRWCRSAVAANEIVSTLLTATSFSLRPCTSAAYNCSSWRGTSDSLSLARCQGAAETRMSLDVMSFSQEA